MKKKQDYFSKKTLSPQVDEKYYTCTNDKNECNPKSSDRRKREIQVGCEVKLTWQFCRTSQLFQLHISDMTDVK